MTVVGSFTRIGLSPSALETDFTPIYRYCVYRLGVPTPQRMSPAARSSARSFFEAMRLFTERAVYVNDLGSEGEDCVREAYGANYPRLAQIKARYDPTNLFRANQNIPPASHSREEVRHAGRTLALGQDTGVSAGTMSERVTSAGLRRPLSHRSRVSSACSSARTWVTPASPSTANPQ